MFSTNIDEGLLQARQVDPRDSRIRQGFGAFSPFALFKEGKFDGLIMRRMKTVIKTTSLAQK